MMNEILLTAAIVILAASIALGAFFLFIRWNRKIQESSIENQDLEVQQLNLSIRTMATSDKKVSFEGSQYNFDADPTTPHKKPLENYSINELSKATDNFSLSNLIEGSVYHGRLKGKNLAIKKTLPDIISKIDFLLFYERFHRHPCILRLYGTCLTEGSDSFVVLEYARNGSLKDWIHGGLAIKSQFIASCECFLTWNQRLKICLQVAKALTHMHQIIIPSYVHRNIKSRNIFLDEEFNAKVGNFGMANCSEVNTLKDDQHSSSSWDIGYLAPEYTAPGTISPSIDIFAYGVVLLEVLSGKSPLIVDDETKDGKFSKLSDEIKLILLSENAEDFVQWMDSSLGESYTFDAAVMLANLARSCVEDDACLRPNAGEIVEKLLRIIEQSPEEDMSSSTIEGSCKPLVKAAAA